MALKKKLEVNNSGATVEYWKITQTNVYWLTGVAHIAIEGWLSEDMRRVGKMPLVAKCYDFGAGNPLPFKPDENIVARMYDWLHTEHVRQEQPDGKMTVIPGLFVDAEDLRTGEKPFEDLEVASKI
jgi:hypothetical protein